MPSAPPEQSSPERLVPAKESSRDTRRIHLSRSFFKRQGASEGGCRHMSRLPAAAISNSSRKRLKPLAAGPSGREVPSDPNPSQLHPPHGVSSNKNVNPMPTGLSFRSREDSQSRAGPIHGRDPTMSNARDRNDAVHPPCSAAAAWKKSSFRQRAVRLHKSLSSPNSNASLPLPAGAPPAPAGQASASRSAHLGERQNRGPRVKKPVEIPKIPLDIASHKLYYVNLEMSLADAPGPARP